MRYTQFRVPFGLSQSKDLPEQDDLGTAKYDNGKLMTKLSEKIINKGIKILNFTFMEYKPLLTKN